MEQKNLLSYFKSFLKKNLAYSASMIFERSIVFLLLPFYTNLLTPAEYGIYSILISTITILGFVVSFGIENGLLKMTAESTDISVLNSTTFWGMFFPGTLITVAIFVFSGEFSNLLFQNTDYSLLVKLSALILFSDNVLRFFLFGEVGEQRAKIYFYVSVIKGVLIVSLNIYLVAFLKMGLEGVMLSYLFTTLIISTGLILLRYHKVKLCFNIKIFKKIFYFGFPVMLTSVFFTLLNFIDTYLLQYYKGSQAVGEYSASYKIGFGMHIIITGFNMAAIPFTSQVMKERPNDKKIFNTMLSTLFSIMISVFMFVSVFHAEIVTTKIFGYSVIAEDYQNAIGIIPLILFSYICYGIYMNFALPFYHREKTVDLAIVTGIAVAINILLNFILIPLFSFWGSAIATLVSFFTLMILMYWKGHKDFYTKYDIKNIVFISSVAIILLILVMKYFEADLIMKITAYVLFQILIVMYLIKLKKEI